MPNSYIHLLISIALQKNVIPQLILIKTGMLLNLHSYLFIDHHSTFFRWELGFFSL